MVSAGIFLAISFFLIIIFSFILISIIKNRRGGAGSGGRRYRGFSLLDAIILSKMGAMDLAEALVEVLAVAGSFSVFSFQLAVFSLRFLVFSHRSSVFFFNLSIFIPTFKNSNTTLLSYKAN